MLKYQLIGAAIELASVRKALPLRAPENPIVTPAMVQSSSPELDVVGAFNPGVTRYEGETLLLLRIAEAPPFSDKEVAAPVLDPHTGRIEIKKWTRSDDVDASDPRVIKVGGRIWLTSISHLRLARSTDGIHFEVDAAPTLSPETEYETFGIEDPRITLIDV